MKLDVAQKISDSRAKIKIIEEQLQSEVNQLFSELFNDLFTKYPQFQRYSFRAYTDYFNDGDTCYFGIQGATIDVEEDFGEEGSYDMYEGENISEVYDRDYYDEHHEFKIVGSSDFQNFAEDMVQLYQFLLDNEDVIQKIYGDHFELTITRDGIERSEYTDHD